MASQPEPNEFLKALRVRVSGPRGMKRFAALCGLPYTTYRNYELGRNRLPFSAARAIADATGEDPFAIIEGREGEAKQDREVLPKAYVLHARGKVTLHDFREKRDLKVRVPVPVSDAEYGKGDDFLKVGDRLVLIAGDDSMAPVILEGDTLIFGPSKKPPAGAIVVAVIGQRWTVKRYFRDSRRKLVTLQSENGAYRAEIVREDKAEARKFKIRGVLLSLRRNAF